MMSDDGLIALLTALVCRRCCCRWSFFALLLARAATNARACCTILVCARRGTSASCARLVSDAVLDNFVVAFFVVTPALPVEFLVASPRCNGEALFVLIHRWSFSNSVVLFFSTILGVRSTCLFVALAFARLYGAYCRACSTLHKTNDTSMIAIRDARNGSRRVTPSRTNRRTRTEQI